MVELVQAHTVKRTDARHPKIRLALQWLLQADLHIRNIYSNGNGFSCKGVDVGVDPWKMGGSAVLVRHKS